ncbi:hypothetical protein EV191_105174 [Tamaricihabitans halophyticus]|uniref:Uncharacterized protein n=1 Tax=Tamaricihabitans halophyticus TaxID=1262583 RepID=A0A4R2R0Z2_9PSEU|nr:hypothetical protein [Tamaricihabitans halophyticus]TCP53111.1 hypothetical protein EV191_105174 [Tamaricihabitans halophyticus]
MSVPQENIESTAPLAATSGAQDADRQAGSHRGTSSRSGGSLHQPWRAFVALGELVVVGLLIWAAIWAWRNGVRVSVLEQQLPDGRVVTNEFTRYYGNWIASAIGIGGLAGLFLLDAVRQLVLALRTRSKRPSSRAEQNRQLDG